MITVNDLQTIIEMGRQQTLYIRWSRGPELDKKQGYSLDYTNHSRHNGLSAQNVRADQPELLAQMLVEYGFLRRKDAKIYCWIFAGVRNGTDSDNAPTIDTESIVPVGKISHELIEKCEAFSEAARNYSQKYAYNAWKPEHYTKNEQLEAEVTRTWNALK